MAARIAYVLSCLDAFCGNELRLADFANLWKLAQNKCVLTFLKNDIYSSRIELELENYLMGLVKESLADMKEALQLERGAIIRDWASYWANWETFSGREVVSTLEHRMRDGMRKWMAKNEVAAAPPAVENKKEPEMGEGTKLMFSLSKLRKFCGGQLDRDDFFYLWDLAVSYIDIRKYLYGQSYQNEVPELAAFMAKQEEKYLPQLQTKLDKMRHEAVKAWAWNKESATVDTFKTQLQERTKAFMSLPDSIVSISLDKDSPDSVMVVLKDGKRIVHKLS